MKIAILGAGAMGMLFGSYLSQHNEVWLLDINQNRVNKINDDGVTVCEQDGKKVFHPRALTNGESLGEMDLIVVFVKAMFTESALAGNSRLIGQNTYIMTLQNGVGHEAKLLHFADRAHVIIGSTQHNSSIVGNGCVNHGGGGMTYIGLTEGDSACLAPIAENITRCGFACKTSNEIKKQIWNKLFLNTAASSLTAILQVPLGFILENPYACGVMEKLAGEAVAVANAEGVADFDQARVIGDIKEVLGQAKEGYTSIYADVRSGARTEVDTISGSVVDSAHALQVPVPYHEMVVALIHALECKMKDHIN